LHRAAATLSQVADRLDDLAEMAELMDDEATALGLRADGARCGRQAMALLDD
jgi:hypothetical protein